MVFFIKAMLGLTTTAMVERIDIREFHHCFICKTAATLKFKKNCIRTLKERDQNKAPFSWRLFSLLSSPSKSSLS
jgi:hypothetical protein